MRNNFKKSKLADIMDGKGGMEIWCHYYQAFTNPSKLDKNEYWIYYPKTNTKELVFTSWINKSNDTIMILKRILEQEEEFSKERETEEYKNSFI